METLRKLHTHKCFDVYAPPEEQRKDGFTHVLHQKIVADWGRLPGNSWWLVHASSARVPLMLIDGKLNGHYLIGA